MTKNKQIFSISETAATLVPDKFGRTSYFLTLGLIAISATIIVVVYQRLPQTIPLYFSLPWGESRLASRIFFFTLPAISLFLAVFNLLLGRVSGKLSPLLPRVLAVGSATVAAMILLAVIGIIQSLVL